MFKYRPTPNFLAALAFIGLAAFAFLAHASVPKDNQAIVVSSDGKFYSDFLLGGGGGGGYVALDISVGSGLASAGFQTIACGTSGTDFTHNVRQYIIAGTNLATATFSIVNPTGDTFTTEGGAVPAGAANNLTFECANPTVAHGGTIMLRVTDGTSTDTTNALTWGTIASGGGPVTARDLIVDWSFNTGAIAARNTTDANGDYVDAARVSQIIPRTTFNITDISNTNPAVVTYSGADPSFVNPDTNMIAGITLPTISTGMTQISRCLIRPLSINTGANTFNAYIDGTTCATSDGNHTLADHAVNATTWGVWGPDATATMWDLNAYDAAGSMAPGSGLAVRVVATAAPPANLVGTASETVYPREGGYFLSQTISKDWDYSAESGNGSPSKNKPRYTFYGNNQSDTTNGMTGTGHSDLPYNTIGCAAVSVYLPSNYDSNDKGGVDATENQILRMAEADAQDEASWTLSIVGNSSLVDHWNYTVDDGLHDPVGNLHKLDNDIGAVTPSVGKWTDFLLKWKTNETNGFTEVWRRYADNTSSATKNETAWTLVYSRGPGVGVGHKNACTNSNCVGGADIEGDDRLGLRNYKYGWLSNTLTTPSWDIFYGIDAVRFTRLSIDGGTCEDVTVDRSNPTP